MAQITLNSSGVASNGTLKLQSNGTTDAVTIDTAQNMGLGVTPSAWLSTRRALQLPDAGYFATAGATLFVTANAYIDSGSTTKYVADGYSTRYRQTNGQHEWFNAASGTAGNAITFTQAMTLDASGNLGIGTTSPTYPIDVVSNSGANALKIRARSGNDYGFMQFSSNDGATRWAEIYATNSSALAFTTGSSGTERARIDSSGNLLVGSSSASGGGERLFVSASLNGFASRIYNYSGSTPQGFLIYYPNVAPNSTGSVFLTCGDNSADRFIVRSNGGIANYSANNVNLSDRREKTNFAPAGDYLAKICSIPVQTFNYIDQNIEEDDGLTLGVVAQDVQAVAPELVMESNWAKEGEEPKMRLSIYQTDLQYALMKALQELKAEFDAYKASHP